MKVFKTKFKGLKIIKHNRNVDRRGSLRETFKKKIMNWENFVLEYATVSKKNILRGFHFQHHYPQAKLVTVIKGKIFDCVIDLRKNSKTFGRIFKCILSETNGKSIFIPPGFAHGFCSLDKENYVIYSCTRYRDSVSEAAIKYNDKQLKINWPIKKPTVSKKDKNAASFEEFKKKFKL